MANLLMSSKEPIAGGELARIYGVSRQIIVQDITILKASGYDILATHNGYILQKSPHAERAIRVCHTSDQTEDELMNITGGYHYHTVRAANEAMLDSIERALAEKGYFAPGEDA